MLRNRTNARRPGVLLLGKGTALFVVKSCYMLCPLCWRTNGVRETPHSLVLLPTVPSQCTQVPLGGGVFFSAANIPGECRPFGFEKYWQKKAAAQNTLVASDTPRLNIEPASLWILSDEHKTNPVECRAYVRRSMNEGTLFDHQSEHTSIQIRSGDLSIRVNHGKIHQVAMRDPSDQYDLPDHIAYQMNIEFERLNIGDNPQVRSRGLSTLRAGYVSICIRKRR